MRETITIPPKVIEIHADISEDKTVKKVRKSKKGKKKRKVDIGGSEAIRRPEEAEM
jgi:hypothetical protein